MGPEIQYVKSDFSGLVRTACPGEVRRGRYGMRENTFPITLSIGVAERTADMAAPKELIGIADQALYAAKRAGRNRLMATGQRGHL